MFPNTKRDEFHRRSYEFDAGQSPSVDEQLLSQEQKPIIEDPEVAAPEEVAGMSGGPDPFRPRERYEQVELCCLDERPMPGDVSFL